MKKYFFSALICSIALVACKTNETIVKETQDEIKTQETTNYNAGIYEVDLKRGENLYTNNCGVCHPLFPAEKYTAAQWKPIVASMKPLAEITDAQSDLIEKYLTSKAKVQ